MQHATQLARSLSTAQRIALVGSPGAGKSTLALQLGPLLDLPVQHLDRLFWRPGWVQADQDAFDAELARVVATDRWIIDGNYSRTLDVRLARADAAIMLDFPRALCLFRVLKRIARYRGTVRPDLAPGCPEQLDFEFLRFVWDYPGRSRARVLERLRSFGETHTFAHIRQPTEAGQLIARLRSIQATPRAPQPPR